MSRCIKSVENQFYATAANGQLVSPAGTTGGSGPPVHHPGPADRCHYHITSENILIVRHRHHTFPGLSQAIKTCAP